MYIFNDKLNCSPIDCDDDFPQCISSKRIILLRETLLNFIKKKLSI